MICHHSALAARDFGGPFPGYSVLAQGYLGVDFFFALSGFIIYHSTVAQRRGPKDYAAARFRRVYIPYWPVGIGMALAYTMFPRLSAGNHAWSWLATLTLAPVDSYPALSVAWTLQHEILFYVLFGVFYFFRFLPIGLAVWGLCILIGLPHLPFDSVNLEFFFGIGAAILYERRLAHPALMLLAIPSILLWIHFGARDADRVFVGLALAFVIAPIAQLERDRFSVPLFLIELGAASYSLYLMHEPLISLTARMVHGKWLILGCSICIGLIGGFAYHFGLERHVIKKRANPEVFAPA